MEATLGPHTSGHWAACWQLLVDSARRDRCREAEACKRAVRRMAAFQHLPHNRDDDQHGTAHGQPVLGRILDKRVPDSCGGRAKGARDGEQ
jgi:hypothetical protein